MKQFVYEPRYVEVYFAQSEAFTMDGWEGFGARVQSNPTGAERHHVQRLWRDAVKENSRDAEQAFWDAVAPRIVEWNLEKRQPDGSTISYPPPAEDPAVVMREIEDAMMRIWLALCVLNAHHPEGLGKLTGSTTEPATVTGEPSPSAASITDSTPSTPRRPKSSSKQSASTSAA